MIGAAEAILRRQRGVTIAGLRDRDCARLGAGSRPAAGMGMAMAWTAERLFLTLAMWWVMMIAMMVPAAAPVVLLYAKAAPQPHSGAFLAGYLLCWLWLLNRQRWRSRSRSRRRAAWRRWQWRCRAAWLAGAVLIAAGLYQFTPLKSACLSHCRNPAQWLSRHYRPGAFGALRMGVSHGAFCVGCCWMLMLLLFVVGVMNLAWIAALTLLVAAEKLLPRGEWIARAGGAAFILGGAVILVRG